MEQSPYAGMTMLQLTCHKCGAAVMKHPCAQTLPPELVFCDNCQNRMTDHINHPAHYTRHPSGIECIQITEHMGFCLGNAVKYIWRASLKGNPIEDLKKARWYIEREISKLEKKEK